MLHVIACQMIADCMHTKTNKSMIELMNNTHYTFYEIWKITSKVTWNIFYDKDNDQNNVPILTAAIRKNHLINYWSLVSWWKLKYKLILWDNVSLSIFHPTPTPPSTKQYSHEIIREGIPLFFTETGHGVLKPQE